MSTHRFDGRKVMKVLCVQKRDGGCFIGCASPTFMTWDNWYAFSVHCNCSSTAYLILLIEAKANSNRVFFETENRKEETVFRNECIQVRSIA